MKIKIVPTTTSTPVGRVAEAELHFPDGPLEGLKLIGFSVWQRRTGGGLNVTFPARSYSINGERRSFALLRPIADVTVQDRIRDAIIAAYEQSLLCGDRPANSNGVACSKPAGHDGPHGDRHESWTSRRCEVRMPLIVRLTGRCANGAERDGGRVTHVVMVDVVAGSMNPAWQTALCGAKPGRLSNGFVAADGPEIPSCKRCRAKAEKAVARG